MRNYLTVQGDTWDKIAWQQLGSELLTPLLLEFNPLLLDVVVFSSGVQLQIPDLPSNYRDVDIPPWRDVG